MTEIDDAVRIAVEKTIARNGTRRRDMTISYWLATKYGGQVWDYIPKVKAAYTEAQS